VFSETVVGWAESTWNASEKAPQAWRTGSSSGARISSPERSEYQSLVERKRESAAGQEHIKAVEGRQAENRRIPPQARDISRLSWDGRE
jgi:hypothetical protein